jgi:hypothetical protein
MAKAWFEYMPSGAFLPLVGSEEPDTIDAVPRKD